MAEQRHDEDVLDEGVPLPLDEHEAPAFAMVREVALQREMGTQDVAWHPELQAGVKCPQCQRYKLLQWGRSRGSCGNEAVPGWVVWGNAVEHTLFTPEIVAKEP